MRCAIIIALTLVAVVAAQAKTVGSGPGEDVDWRSKRGTADLVNGLMMSQPSNGMASLRQFGKRGNADLVNGLIQLKRRELVELGKRGTADLVSGLVGANHGYASLRQLGKRGNADLVNGLVGVDTGALASIGKR